MSHAILLFYSLLWSSVGNVVGYLHHSARSRPTLWSSAKPMIRPNTELHAVSKKAEMYIKVKRLKQMVADGKGYQEYIDEKKRYEKPEDGGLITPSDSQNNNAISNETENVPSAAEAVEVKRKLLSLGLGKSDPIEVMKKVLKYQQDKIDQQQALISESLNVVKELSNVVENNQDSAVKVEKKEEIKVENNAEKNDEDDLIADSTAANDINLSESSTNNTVENTVENRFEDKISDIKDIKDVKDEIEENVVKIAFLPDTGTDDDKRYFYPGLDYLFSNIHSSNSPNSLDKAASKVSADFYKYNDNRASNDLTTDENTSDDKNNNNNNIIDDVIFRSNFKIISMPDIYVQNTKRYEQKWMEYMRTLDLDSYDIVIAHGSSSEALLRYMESKKIQKSVLIDCSDIYTAGERHGRAYRFSLIDENCKKISLICTAEKYLIETTALQKSLNKKEIIDLSSVDDSAARTVSTVSTARIESTERTAVPELNYEMNSIIINQIFDAVRNLHIDL